jgi:GntR family transcriptional regulator / MocR family aminotransferase
MDIQLSIHGRQDLAGQLYRQLRAAIVEGRLAGGARLPSTRDLAEQLGVSRKTTLEVFERLQGEGFLLSRTGLGTFVADGLQRAPAASPDFGFVSSASFGPAPNAFWAGIPDMLSMPARQIRPKFDFLGGVTDKKRFPFDIWRRCINHALRMQARDRGDYKDPGGDQSLRLAIARYVSFNRAVNCNWTDVIVTQGAQQALDLLARVLLSPGDAVAVEEPGYPPAHTAFAAAGARILSVPVDSQGIDTSQLPGNAKLTYVTPSHQFPLGIPMTIERRVALLEWAGRHQSVIVEDDYDGEFRFTGRPLESLASLDQKGLVAYVGTFSKTLFPELRIGYVIAPPSLRGALLKAKQTVDWHSCTLTQMALARFMLEGHFARHLRRVHKAYAERRDTLIAHLSGPLSPGSMFYRLRPASI